MLHLSFNIQLLCDCSDVCLALCEISWHSVSVIVAAAIECSGSALPTFTSAVSATAHTGTFSYNSVVDFSCPAGSRFEDGRTNMPVTCSDYGWAWPAIVTSCGGEIQTSRDFLTIVTRSLNWHWFDWVDNVCQMTRVSLCIIERKVVHCVVLKLQLSFWTWMYKDKGQTVQTLVPLSSSCIIWCRPKANDVIRLGR